MRHWDRCSRKGDFFYAVMVIAAFMVMRFSFFAEVVEYASSFSYAEASHASEDAGWQDRRLVVAAGEKK